MLGGRGFESHTVKNCEMVVFAQMEHLPPLTSFLGQSKLVGALEGKWSVSDTLEEYEG